LVEVVTMLMRAVPFHEPDRSTHHKVGTARPPVPAAAMPTDRCDHDEGAAEFDLPGV
jgi:hypothetical protein